MTTRDRIGGHEGMDVYRKAGGILKVASTQEAARGIGNEFAMLLEMHGHHAPVAIDERSTKDQTLQQDVGMSANYLFPDPEKHHDAMLWQFIDLLHELRTRGIRHGDLTPPNLVIDTDNLWALDWQESHYLDDPPPTEKRETSDSWQLMDTFTNLTGDPRRIARRWNAILEDLGAHGLDPVPLDIMTFVDIGCHDGAMVGLAAAEGMVSIGIDNSSAAIVYAQDNVPGRVQFRSEDAFEWANEELFIQHFDVATFLSTFAWILGQRTRHEAESVLKIAILSSAVLYFETQLAGDGPGPEWLRTDGDVLDLLLECGGRDVKPILTLPIAGRDASRTLWAVR